VRRGRVTPWAPQYRGCARGAWLHDHDMYLLVALGAFWVGVCLFRFVSFLDGLCRAGPSTLPYFVFLSINYVGRTSSVLLCRIFCLLLFTYWIAYMGRGLCTIFCLDVSPEISCYSFVTLRVTFLYALGVVQPPHRKCHSAPVPLLRILKGRKQFSHSVWRCPFQRHEASERMIGSYGRAPPSRPPLLPPLYA